MVKLVLLYIVLLKVAVSKDLAMPIREDLMYTYYMLSFHRASRGSKLLKKKKKGLSIYGEIKTSDVKSLT